MRNSRPCPRPSALPICSEQRLSRSPGVTTSSPDSVVATATSSSRSPSSSASPVRPPALPGRKIRGGGIPRRVRIDQKHATAELHHRRREIDRRRALAHAPFRIGHRDASHEHPPSPSRGVKPLRDPNHELTTCYRCDHGPSMSRSLGIKVPAYPVASLHSHLGPMKPAGLGGSGPTFPRPKCARSIGVLAPCSLVIEASIKTGTIGPSPDQQLGTLAHGNHRTMSCQVARRSRGLGPLPHESPGTMVIRMT